MGLKRRDFVKGVGITTLLGLGGLGGFWGLEEALNLKKAFGSSPGLPGNLRESLPDPQALQGKHWAIVIDLSKIQSVADLEPALQACRQAHNVPTIEDRKSEVKWIWTEDYEHTFPTQKNSLAAQSMERQAFPVLCNHCENPPCVRVCPTQATYKRPDGIVAMDYHRCIGCRFCMAACPYGARSFNFQDPRPFVKDPNPEFPLRTKGVVEKCNLCAERLDKGQQPICVEKSKGAILFGDLADSNSEIRKLMEEHFMLQRKPELGTGPNIYYMIRG